jgi:hypothetical protein
MGGTFGCLGQALPSLEGGGFDPGAWAHAPRGQRGGSLEVWLEAGSPVGVGDSEGVGVSLGVGLSLGGGLSDGDGSSDGVGDSVVVSVCDPLVVGGGVSLPVSDGVGLGVGVVVSDPLGDPVSDGASDDVEVAVSVGSGAGSCPVSLPVLVSDGAGSDGSDAAVVEEPDVEVALVP